MVTLDLSHNAIDHIPESMAEADSLLGTCKAAATDNGETAAADQHQHGLLSDTL